MITVKHRFLDHQINSETETLIIGTFNPDTDGNIADFFYGRSKNYLWRLLPSAFGKQDLKGALKQEKLEFIKQCKIGFIDLIEEVQVENGQETNFYDGYIDKRVTTWRNIVEVIDSLPNLKRVCFTRCTFSDIPNMKKQFDIIQKHCEKKGLVFKALTTPARFYSEKKQEEWTKFLLDDSK